LFCDKFSIVIKMKTRTTRRERRTIFFIDSPRINWNLLLILALLFMFCLYKYTFQILLLSLLLSHLIIIEIIIIQPNKTKIDLNSFFLFCVNSRISTIQKKKEEEWIVIRSWYKIYISSIICIISSSMNILLIIGIKQVFD
jgi:hypothetical protein